MNKQLKLPAIAVVALAVPMLSASAGDKPFPTVVPALEYSQPEGFAIGKGHTAYNGSVDGSIFKMDLRSGEGAVLNPNETPDPYDCLKLGMRVDSRTNNLFVAGCWYENLLVYDADTGEAKAEYQLGPMFESVVNDLTITNDAVYVTDSFLPVIYRLPLAANGGLPPNADGVTTIALPEAFEMDWETDYCCGGNGIVATPDGKTLVIGHSLLSALYRVDPATGDVVEIEVSPPLTGFLDGLVLHNNTLYIMNPDWELVQVVELDKEMLTGNFVGTIHNPNMNGVASGALFGKSLYVNNAHYDAGYFDEDGNLVWNYSERSVTRLNRHDVEPVE
jgi:sugar lactone lactonase YvrE